MFCNTTYHMLTIIVDILSKLSEYFSFDGTLFSTKNARNLSILAYVPPASMLVS